MSTTTSLVAPSDEEIDKLYDAFQKYLEGRLDSVETKIPSPKTFSNTPKDQWDTILPNYEDAYTSIKVANRLHEKFIINISWGYGAILGCYYDVTHKNTGLTFTLYGHYNVMHDDDPSWHLRFNDHPVCVVTWQQIVDGYQTVKDWYLIAKLAT